MILLFSVSGDEIVKFKVLTDQKENVEIIYPELMDEDKKIGHIIDTNRFVCFYKDSEGNWTFMEIIPESLKRSEYTYVEKHTVTRTFNDIERDKSSDEYVVIEDEVTYVLDINKEQLIESVLINRNPALKRISKNSKEQLKDYFSSAPIWILDSMNIKELKENEIFIESDEPAKDIFILVDGVVEALDVRIYDGAFAFKEFHGVYAFGGMEVIIQEDKYMATLRTVTKCTLIKISRKHFEKW